MLRRHWHRRHSPGWWAQLHPFSDTPAPSFLAFAACLSACLPACLSACRCFPRWTGPRARSGSCTQTWACAT
jgi:hypothetical protein